jgi:TRAP-type uncharacterized transport system fused permease subunit
MSTLEVSAKTIAPVTAACAGAGIIIGCIFSSGLSMKFSTLIVEMSRGYLWLALLLTMFVSIILGMGITVTAVYRTLAALVAPALIDTMGVYPMAAHMFCLYFGNKSYITPPVCLASYAAAGIAGSDPMKTAYVAFKIGIAGFIVPFMFVYSPELLLHGASIRIIWVVLTSLAGIICLAIAVEGWFLTTTGVVDRLLMLVASIALINPRISTTAIGFVLVAVVLCSQKMKRSQKRKFPFDTI